MIFYEVNDQILIAIKEFNTGEIQVFEYNSALTSIETNLDVFSSVDITDIKLKISQVAGNNSAYLMGRNNNDAFAYARFDHAAGDFDLATPNAFVNLDNDFDLIESNNAGNYDITAGTLANQLLMGITDIAGNSTYLLNITGAVPSIDCSYDGDQVATKCMKVTPSTTQNSFDQGVALSDVFENVTIGSDGADTTNENTNSIILFGHHVDDGGGNILTDSRAIMGLINVSPITLSGDDTAPGIKYNIPYVNN